ncbi:DNA-binding transcriptional regulator, LacI/PurR family [Nonomuraea solani]|uniref:DNA-binding transcriptional regulator, LacI/PurR family n=1 Tax=Nonomuraea solani TaxID=1144553 RepID=A0A1H6EUV4_9ACTN|nr:LacI family DNA-binding transcriptional regulator [Nonomuraea solani]SEH00705.1 DNA-binding transcriptional regulator, LacI/PurR family [Nonomuraea solani]
MVTQRDVARRAGVSVRTVSNVVNNFAYVSEETRAQVQRALDELDYRPNLAARSLNRGRSNLLALVLPLDVPYFTELAAHVVDQAEERGYTVLLDRTEGSAERERQILMRRDRSALFDGFIFSPLGLTEDELRSWAGDCPAVMLGEVQVEGVDHVAIDDTAAAKAATEHLISLGRTRIAAIGVPHRPKASAGRPARATAAHRSAGYEQALTEAGLPIRPELTVRVRRYQRQDGRDAMERLLDLAEPPDAVFCYNDLLALGAMRAVLARGLRVPQDVAVAGFDGIDEGRFATPPLTTVVPDKARIAELAVTRLLERVEGDKSPAVQLEAPWRLMIDESTAGVPEAGE